MKKNNSKKLIKETPMFMVAPKRDDLTSSSLLRILSKSSHKRSQSNKFSPYLDTKHLARCCKPFLSGKSSPNQPSTKHSRKNSGLRKKLPRSQKTSDSSKLIPLEEEPVFRGPRIYPNQIFADVYDSQGNHDRVLEMEESIEVYQEVKEPSQAKGPCIVFKLDNSTEPTGNVKPPENSFVYEKNDKGLDPNDLFVNLGKLTDNRRYCNISRSESTEEH